MRALFAFGTVVVAAAAAILVGSAAWIFWDAWKSSDLETFRALVGGFTGAFFAYLFIRFGDALKKLYDRKEINHTALVKLQHYFNDCMNAMNDNVFIVDDCARALTDERLEGEHAALYGNRFQLCAIDRENIGKLTTVDYLNDVSSLLVSLTKTNHSLQSIERSYELFRDAALAKNIELPVYQMNARLYRDRCLEMRPFLKQQLDELVRLYAIANILLEDRPFFVSVILRFSRSTYPDNLEQRLGTEVPKVKKGIAMNAESSRRKIQDAVRK
jgi:hypothetical protein